jgi:hypothetical protein
VEGVKGRRRALFFFSPALKTSFSFLLISSDLFCVRKFSAAEKRRGRSKTEETGQEAKTRGKRERRIGRKKIGAAAYLCGNTISLSALRES